MKNHKRARIALLMSMALGVAVLSGSYTSISVYASEGVQSTNGELSDEVTNGDVTDDNNMKETDDAGEASSDYAATSDTAEVPSEYDVEEEVPEIAKDYAGEDSTEEISEEAPVPSKEGKAPVDKVSYKDVCFFIRGEIGENDIPYEPSNHLSGNYSDAIRVNNAGTGSRAVVADTSKEGLMSDGFTVANEVTDTLTAVPSASQIASVVKGFDPDKHYVKWYVYKWATTSGNNYDVFYHVDGVILEKEVPVEEKPSKEPEEEPVEEPKKEEPEIPEYVIEIKTNCDDMEIEYDGQPHKVGGFTITVIDIFRNKTVLQHIFDWAGVFKETKVYASDGHGTTFEYAGEEYWVNVDAAYAEVTEVGDYTIPFYYNGSVISLDDIYILDSAGNRLSGKFDIVPTRATVHVTKREITLEAGTTVKNDDGKSLTNNTYKITEGSLMPGHKICEVSFIGCQTGPGETTNEISSYVIRDANGNDVTYMYDVDLEKGRLVLVDNSRTAKNVGTGTDMDTDDPKSATNTTGSASTTRVVTSDGKEVVTNTTYEYAGQSDDEVLGARRADTSDATDDLYRLFVCSLALLAAYIFITRRKKY